MKKFFTLIALTSAIIPAIHGMETSLPADVQKQYDNLTALVHNADAEAFKPAFDAITLPTESIAALRNTVAQAKTAVTNELEAMGDKTKSWSKMAKGGLATFGGLWAGISVPAVIHMMRNIKNETPIFLVTGLPAFVPAGGSIVALETALGININSPIRQAIVAINFLPCLGAAYKAIPYGLKTFKAGLNYKEHLQTMLANLDAIDTHITQAKA